MTLLPCIDFITVANDIYKNGEVDWDAIGQEVTRCILQEVESIAAVDKKYGSGIKGLQHDTEWR